MLPSPRREESSIPSAFRDSDASIRAELGGRSLRLGLTAWAAAFAMSGVPLEVGAQVGVDADLQQARRMLAGARLTASDKLQKQGQLSAGELNAANAMIKDAEMVWVSCIISRVNQTPKAVDAESGARQAIATCRGDRDELGAWMRFAGQAHKDEIPEARIRALLDAKEADNRRRAEARLRQRP